MLGCGLQPMSANVTIRYGKLEFANGREVPLTWPVDVLLRPSELAVADLGTVSGVGLFGKADEPSPQITASHFKRARLLQTWKRRGVIADVGAAARAATGGRISPRIAEHLGHVTFQSENEATVADFPALVALSLQHVARSGGRYEVRDCANCGEPFLATEQAAYCRRLAPNSAAQTCMQAGKVRDFRERKRQEREE